MFEVCATQCDQCLFSPDRIVPKKRMVQILKDCRANDTHFSCHKATIEGKDVCCKGFYDTQPSTNLMRIAQRLGMVKFVAIDDMASAKTKAYDDIEGDDLFEPEEE